MELAQSIPKTQLDHMVRWQKCSESTLIAMVRGMVCHLNDGVWCAYLRQIQAPWVQGLAFRQRLCTSTKYRRAGDKAKETRFL